MTDRPLSERVRVAEMTDDWWEDPLSGGSTEFDAEVLADEIAALEVDLLALTRHLDAANLRERRLEAERDRLRTDVRWLLAGVDDVWAGYVVNADRLDAIRAELEGGDDE